MAPQALAAEGEENPIYGMDALDVSEGEVLPPPQLSTSPAHPPRLSELHPR
jgi:hypothetical protein